MPIAPTQAAEVLRLDWDSVHRIVERAVARGTARRSTEGVRYVGLDEKSLAVASVTSRSPPTSRHLGSWRSWPATTEAAGESLWQALPPEQGPRSRRRRWTPGAGFVAATRVQAPQAAIVHDKFHVAKLLNDAVDQTRRAEHQLQAEGDDTLKHTRYLWLHSQLPEAKQADFADLLEINLKTARAWAYKKRLSSSGPSRTRPRAWTSTANGSAPRCAAASQR